MVVLIPLVPAGQKYLGRVITEVMAPRLLVPQGAAVAQAIPVLVVAAEVAQVVLV